MLNYCHNEACGGHLLGLDIAQKILHPGYFLPSIFEDCIEAVKRCHPCQVYTWKMRGHATPLFHLITISPFTKWGIDFTTCNLLSTANHKYIILAVDYVMKWAKAMPTYKNDSETSLLLFNQIISHLVSRERLSLIMAIISRTN